MQFIVHSNTRHLYRTLNPVVYSNNHVLMIPKSLPNSTHQKGTLIVIYHRKHFKILFYLSQMPLLNDIDKNLFYILYSQSIKINTSCMKRHFLYVFGHFSFNCHFFSNFRINIHGNCNKAVKPRLITTHPA